MSYVFTASAAITTSTAGAATVYTPAFTGKVSVVKYTPTDTASTADITVTTNTTGQSVWSESNLSKSAATIRYPRSVAHTTAGAASGIAQELIPVVEESLKIVIAQGGNTKTGAFQVIVV